MTTMTFRLPVAQRNKLRRKARLLGMTESELLRDILSREIEDRPMSKALAKLKGVMKLDYTKLDGWQKSIHENNWRE